MQTDINRTKRYVTVAIVLVAALSLVFILLATVGYARLQIDLPADYQLRVNGHLVSGQTVRVRGGTYNLSVVAPTKSLIGSTISVHPFESVTVTDKFFRDRTATQIVSSLIGANGGYGAPIVDQAHWFQNNTWLVAVAGPGSSTPLVAHYTGGAWSLVYYDTTGYSNDYLSMPPEVTQALNGIKALGGD